MARKMARKNHRPYNALRQVEAGVEQKLMELKRDIILESDVVFAYNVASLKTTAPNLPASQVRAHRTWLIQSALRRNHVSAHEARQMA